ncbi:MAG: hypothetical protein HYR64_02115 [Fimbriimonas ginsengisoli]|uniref:Uncharacterized protein n=1 Tax=Fimbriimonas ginsengisoli TaxID=1005039 RepID=A0A931LR08_FIMGI|nr:hypothetical protein [Fimbriimonas ginsengisoli]
MGDATQDRQQPARLAGIFNRRLLRGLRSLGFEKFSDRCAVRNVSDVVWDVFWARRQGIMPHCVAVGIDFGVTSLPLYAKIGKPLEVYSPGHFQFSKSLVVAAGKDALASYHFCSNLEATQAADAAFADIQRFALPILETVPSTDALCQKLIKDGVRVGRNLWAWECDVWFDRIDPLAQPFKADPNLTITHRVSPAIGVATKASVLAPVPNPRKRGNSRMAARFDSALVAALAGRRFRRTDDPTSAERSLLWWRNPGSAKTRAIVLSRKVNDLVWFAWWEHPSPLEEGCCVAEVFYGIHSPPLAQVMGGSAGALDPSECQWRASLLEDIGEPNSVFCFCNDRELANVTRTLEIALKYVVLPKLELVKTTDALCRLPHSHYVAAEPDRWRSWCDAWLSRRQTAVNPSTRRPEDLRE